MVKMLRIKDGFTYIDRDLISYIVLLKNKNKPLNLRVIVNVKSFF